MNEMIRFSVDLDEKIEKQLSVLARNNKRDRKAQAEVILEEYFDKGATS